KRSEIRSVFYFYTMASFLRDVIDDLIKNEVDWSKMTVVLPSKRAGVFLKFHLSTALQQTAFSPEIVSIEEFVESISGLQYIDNTKLLFEFYRIYIRITPKEHIETFDSFTTWAQLLLQDF